MFTSNVTFKLFASLEAFPVVALAGWNMVMKLLACVLHSKGEERIKQEDILLVTSVYDREKAEGQY